VEKITHLITLKDSSSFYLHYSTPERGEIMREGKRQMQDSSMAVHNYHTFFYRNITKMTL